MTSKKITDLILNWRQKADELENHMSSKHKVSRTGHDWINYVQNNAVVGTLRTCANELESMNEKKDG